MQLDRSGKAPCPACETLAPGPQRQMLPLNLLRIPRAWVVLGGVEVPGVGAPIIGVIAGDPTGLPQCFSTAGTPSSLLSHLWGRLSTLV